MEISFRAPDVKAPRFRPPTKRILNRNVYNEFLEKFPEHKGLLYKEFETIIRTFHKNLVQGIADNRAGVDLPERMGRLIIISCARPKNGMIDMKASMDAGKVIKHKNWDSHHRLMKIIYSNADNQYMMKNKAIWYLNLIRPNKKTLSDAFRNYPTRYIPVQPKEKLQKILEKEQRTYRIQARDNEAPKHDEFDMT